MKCRCKELTELSGCAAADYMRFHLVETSVDSDMFEAMFRCPKTGRQWLLTHKYPEMQGDRDSSSDHR
jgi:hypothetical protein